MPRPRTLLFAVLAIVAIILFARSTSSSDKSFYDNTVEALRLKQEEGQQHKMGTAAVKDAQLREASEHVKIKVQQEAEERRKKEGGESVADQNGHKHPIHAADTEKGGDAQKVMGGVDEEVVAGKAKENRPHEVGTSRGKWTDDDAATAVDAKPEQSEHDKHMDAVLEHILKRGPIIIFSKTYCPYSKKAKAVFSQYAITPEPVIVEVDMHELGTELQDKLLETTGRRTVPNVLINGKSIGGGDDVAALHEKGELLKTIREMGGKRIMEAKLRE